MVHILVFWVELEKKTIFAVKCHFVALRIIKFEDSNEGKVVTFCNVGLCIATVC